MKTPIKLTNPLSDHPTEMWLQAIADFEETFNTPGYEIDMNHWYFPRENEVCLVCMAGASMARRTEGLALNVSPDDYPDQDRRKFYSINRMRESYFEHAIELLDLPGEEEARWLEAIQAAGLEGPQSFLCSAHIEEDWHDLIELLREAIARIDAEYQRLSK